MFRVIADARGFVLKLIKNNILEGRMCLKQISRVKMSKTKRGVDDVGALNFGVLFGSGVFWTSRNSFPVSSRIHHHDFQILGL